MDDKINNVMKKNDFLNNENNEKFWFSEYAHRWSDEALPMGYAMACLNNI